LGLCALEVHSSFFSFFASYPCSRAARVICWLRPLARGQLCCAWIPAFHSEDLACHDPQRWAIGLVVSYRRYDTVTGPRTWAVPLYKRERHFAPGALPQPNVVCFIYAPSPRPLSTLETNDHLVVVTCLAWPTHWPCFVMHFDWSRGLASSILCL